MISSSGTFTLCISVNIRSCLLHCFCCLCFSSTVGIVHISGFCLEQQQKKKKTKKSTPMINCLAGLIFQEKKICSAACLPCRFSILCCESAFKQVCPSNFFVNYSLIHPESNPGLFWSSLCWALPVQVSELPCSSSCSCWRLGWGMPRAGCFHKVILSDGVCVSGGFGRV